MIQLVYINSIPHWFDGETALPIMAGGQTNGQSLIDWFNQQQQQGGGTVPNIPTTQQTLSSLVNRLYMDTQTNFAGKLIRRQNTTGGAAVYFLVDPNRYGKVPWQQVPKLRIATGTQLLDPITRTAFTVGGGIGEYPGKSVITGEGGALIDYYLNANELTESDWERLFGPAGGGGVSADTGATLANQKAMQDAALAAQAAENEKQRQFQAEQAKLAAENQMKLQRLGEAGSLARTAAEVQQRARQLIAELTGVDPIRAAVAAQGGVQQGTTPAQAFTGQLKGISSAPIPQVSAEATIPEIEQTIGVLQGQQQLPVAPALGFAEGGTIDMAQGADGTYSMVPSGPMMSPTLPPQMDMAPMQPEMQPQMQGGPGIQQGTTKQAILVGEAGSQIAPGTEVMLIDSANPGKVEVVPLVSQAAEGGQFDLSTIQQSLAPLYAKLGFQGIPTVARDQGWGSYGLSSGGGQWGPQTGSIRTAQMLGFKPRLVRTHEGIAYFVDPQGRYHHIATPEAMSGFNPKDFLQVHRAEIEGSPGGPPLTTPPSIMEGPPKMYPMRTPLIAPVGGGVPLFDPRLLAGIWRFLDPSTQNVLTSAYGTAGFGTPEQARQQIEQTVAFFQPTGTGGVPARLG